MKTVLDVAQMSDNASSLGSFITSAGYLSGVDLNTLYVKDEEGNNINHAIIQEEILTDGSKVYNLVLYKDRG